MKTITRMIHEMNYKNNEQITQDDSNNLKKSEPEIARYLLVDSRPIVSIRARLRLHVDLSFTRLHRYRKRETENCDFCDEPRGDTNHILLHCPAFKSPRSKCEKSLLSIAPKEELTKGIILGHLPKINLHNQKLSRKEREKLKHHDKCLNITSKYLADIAMKIFL